MEHGKVHQVGAQAVMVRDQGLGHGQQFVPALSGLVEITQETQASGGKAQGHDRRGRTVDQRIGVVLFGVIEGDGGLHLVPGLGQRSEVERGRSQGRIGFENQALVLHTLGQTEALQSEFAGCLQVRPHGVKHRQAI